MLDLTQFFSIMQSDCIAPEIDLVAHYDAFGRYVTQIFHIVIQHEDTGSESVAEVVKIHQTMLNTVCWQTKKIESGPSFWENSLNLLSGSTGSPGDHFKVFATKLSL